MSLGRRVLLAAFVLLALVLGTAVSQRDAASRAASPPGQLVDTLTLKPHPCPCPAPTGKVPLVAGQTYTLVISGTDDEVYTGGQVASAFSHDALYEYASSGADTECSSGCPKRYEGFVVGVKGAPLTAIDRSPPQDVPYSATHTYTVKFVPSTGGVFETSDLFGYGPPPRFTPGGGFTIEIYGGEQKQLTYAMPDRFGKVGANGLIEYATTREEIDAKIWPVDFTVPCKPGKLVAYTWEVDGKKRSAEPVRNKPCTFAVDVGKLGKHHVTAKAPDGTEYAADADARDFLIVGLGDSNGSGEGTPDIPGAGVRWEDLRCDRSAKSYEAQAALGVEHNDTHSSVTFVHLACSGATVHEGLLGLYEGINPKPGIFLPAQLSLLPALIGDRPVDAVMISIGVNDLKFGPMTAFCLDKTNCPVQKYPDASSKTTLDEWMKEHVAALPAEYDEVAARLGELGIPPSHVYLSQYFDSTRDQNGNTCNPLVRVYGVGTFDQAEAAWAYQNVLVPLNQAVAAAVTKHHWRLISGAQEAFRRHGYCSDTPWITTLKGSLANQHDKNGTLHANETGQAVDAKLALRQLLPDLFPGGKPRPLGATAGGSGGTGGTGAGGASTPSTPAVGGTTTTPAPSGPNPTEGPAQAASDLSKLLGTNAAACGYTKWNVTAKGTPGHVAVAATLTGALSGTAVWSIVGGVVTPRNALAAKVSAGCP